LVSYESRLSHTSSKASSDPFFTRKRFMAMNIIASPVDGRTSPSSRPPQGRRRACRGRPWHNATTMQVGGFSSAEQRLSAEPYRQRALDRDPRAEERKRPRVQRVNRVWSDKERGRARTAMKHDNPHPWFRPGLAGYRRCGGLLAEPAGRRKRRPAACCFCKLFVLLRSMTATIKFR
jgi:hypothetical protein